MEREDLRHLSIFSIDSSGAKSLDDAMHCTKLENGIYEVIILLFLY